MKPSEAQKKKIRQSAKGEKCTLNIPGVCNFNPETVVWCHFPDESKGIGIKSFDLSGGYGCSADHDFLDGRAGNEALYKRAHMDMEYYMRRSQTRTLKRLLEKGVLKIT